MSIGNTNTDQTIIQLREAINSHDADQVADAFTSDYRNEVPMHPARSFTGNDRVRENWTAILTRVPDLRAQILRFAVDTASGQTWSEWEMTGPAPDGDPVIFRGVVISTARDGKIASTRFYLDEVTGD